MKTKTYNTVGTIQESIITTQILRVRIMMINATVTIIIVTALFIVPVVVDIVTVDTVARKCYMKMPTLIQRIIVP
jgi:hypothetical protein